MYFQGNTEDQPTTLHDNKLDNTLRLLSNIVNNSKYELILLVSLLQVLVMLITSMIMVYYPISLLNSNIN